MQADTVSLQARGWGRLLAGLGPFEDEDAEVARTLLAGFDGDLSFDSGPALLYACFLRALAEALYRPALGAETWAWMTSGTLAPMLPMIRRWLGNDTWELLGGPVPPGRAPDGKNRHLIGRTARPVARGDNPPYPPSGPGPSGTGPSASTRDRVLAVVPGALAAAWAAAVKAGGPNPRQWRWGDLHRAVRVHPLAGPFPGAAMGGDADTIQAAGYGWRQGSPFTVATLSVYRQVVDLADPASASYVVPGGASGDPASRHFSDQLPRWASHQRITMRTLLCSSR
jgi:penicillin amidase